MTNKPFIILAFQDHEGNTRQVPLTRETYQQLLLNAEQYERTERERKRQKQEEDRRKAEERRKAREARGEDSFEMDDEAWERIFDAFADFNTTWQRTSANFNSYSRNHTGNRSRPRARPNGGRYTSVSAWARLCSLAGVDESTPRDQKLKVIRKAQRACHPDTGGSHDKWIELEQVVARL